MLGPPRQRHSVCQCYCRSILVYDSICSAPWYAVSVHGPITPMSPGVPDGRGLHVKRYAVVQPLHIVYIVIAECSVLVLLYRDVT